MAIAIKYNKTALYELGRQLKAREAALPTLKSKEAALRMEVKRLNAQAVALEQQLQALTQSAEVLASLWVEFEDELVNIREAVFSAKTVAGVQVPVLEKLAFTLAEISPFHKPDWFLDGIKVIEEWTRVSIQRDVARRAADLLERARKKTTQKVNLYEKVQIPEYQEAIRKIKRFLEDEENLSKAAQKILKRRTANAAAP